VLAATDEGEEGRLFEIFCCPCFAVFIESQFRGNQRAVSGTLNEYPS